MNNATNYQTAHLQNSIASGGLRPPCLIQGAQADSDISQLQPSQTLNAIWGSLVQSYRLRIA